MTSEKVYKIYKVKDGEKVFVESISALDIHEAIHELVKSEEGKKFKVINEYGEEREILISFGKYQKPERFLVKFSHYQKDEKLFYISDNEKNNEYAELEKIHIHPVKLIKLDSNGNEDGATYGFEFFNQYESAFSLGMNSWDELNRIKTESMADEIKHSVKNEEIKKMVQKYGGAYFNDEWIKIDLP
jgi:hypothetical protein